MSRWLKGIILFIVLYGLFSLSGFLFPIDPSWYNSLQKPSWTPPGAVIGIVWGILYAFIAGAFTLSWYKHGFEGMSQAFYIVFAINYVTNQLFSFFQFTLKDLLLATIDTAIVAITAGVLVIMYRKYSRVSSIMMIPYFLWTLFAIYLAFTIYQMNPTETLLK
ncbi:TspO/MBR family protein [Pontibacillus sp. HMF3514]|uniref:TspO/MBR family protein n=1 Tax=Pontibacillus sp. HMF3514 TaxID=2692425 RepID=UPI00131F920B|nr:tryptophan-rich sensory protein [Pontibacillus sp. HMF3514]QHE53376.1 tryptophan-rich sensory protein [Pontibacillus sp. HMF3514]